MYDIHRHKHSYAIWTASRAWNRKLKGGNLALAQRLIEVSGLEGVRNPDDIGTDVDAWLLETMRLIVDYADQNHIPWHQLWSGPEVGQYLLEDEAGLWRSGDSPEDQPLASTAR